MRSGESARSSPSLVLYFAPGASSMAPHIALHEIGVPFEARPVSLANRGTHTPEFLALNPEGKVPTLLVDGRPLTEVAAILFFLAKRFPEAGLLPDDEERQAHVVSWMSFAASTLHSARRQGIDHARAVFSLADARLGGSAWAVGAYSIADIHLFRIFWRFGKLLNLDASDVPNLARHHDAMMERPAVRRTCDVEAAIGYELPA